MIIDSIDSAVVSEPLYGGLLSYKHLKQLDVNGKNIHLIS